MVKLIAGMDLETTGFDYLKGDRIVEACFNIYRQDDDGLTLLKTIEQRIDPERSMPAAAQAVHGISLDDLKGKPKWVDFAPTVKKILEKVDLVVIHNAGFDQPFITAAMEAAGLPVKFEAFCTMENGRWATFDGKSPSLKELCWSLGIEYDPSKAHGASYDVSVMMDCYQKAKILGLFK